MDPFVFNTTPSIRFGDGLIDQIGVLGADLFGKSVLLITDAGLADTPIVARAVKSLKDAGFDARVFTDVVADPPEHVVLNAAEAARSCNAVLGIGGGSSLDVAKLAAFLAASDQKLPDAYGVGNAAGPRLPLVLVPTTAGTGSEVTPISIVTTGSSEKMGVVSPILLPDLAVLDPSLTLQLPSHITAATGIDAMVHAIEAYASASPNNNPISKGLACQALRFMGPNLLLAVNEPSNVEARSAMLLGSMLAGQAFANAPVAAVHALAYPIGGHFKVPHGLSNALVLPHVLRFNAETHPEAYAEIASDAFPELANETGQGAALAFADALANLAAQSGLQTNLRDVGIQKDDLALLTKDAMKQTRLMVNNPRPMTQKDVHAIYESAL